MAVYGLHIEPLGGGAPLASFTLNGRMGASIDRVAWVLNQPGSMTFRAPLDHPATAAVGLLTSEVAVTRNGAVIWRGYPLQRDRDGAAATFTCAGLLWPFTRWHIGPNTTDFLNGRLRFEQGLTGWSVEQCYAEPQTDIVRDGTQAVAIANENADNDAYIETSFIYPDTGEDGHYFEVAAEYLIHPGMPWLGPAYEERGLYIHAPNAVPDAHNWEPITNASPHGVWTRVKTGINLPPNLIDETVTIRCYSPGGGIIWDNGAVREEAGLGAVLHGADAAVVFQSIVDYCQSTKSDLGLTTDMPATGTTIRDGYAFWDLPNAFQIMETYPERGLLDYAVIDRTITTYPGRRGQYRPDHPLTVTPNGATVLTYEHRTDGTATATRVIRTGDGDGATRDYHQVTDTTYTNGLVLEDVATGPTILGPNVVRNTAATDLARLRDLGTMPSGRVPADGWLGEVTEGDVIDVVIDDGAIQESTRRRVVGVTLEPVTDTITFDLGDEPE